MQLDLKTVAAFVRTADTEDLLDRVTVYRDGMEPAAVDLMENELWRRGLTLDEVADHETERRERMVIRADGSPVRCSFCDRPAITKRWGWFKLWRRVPIFPRLFPRCGVHGPAAQGTDGG
jgi:hypothetical protein